MEQVNVLVLHVEIILHIINCSVGPLEDLRSIYLIKKEPRATSIYLWLDWIIACNLTLCVCEHPTYRHNTNAKLLDHSRQTIRKYALLVQDQVVKAISAILPERFGLIFDGWSDGYGSHYVAIFAVYEAPTVVQGKCLLACSPLNNETNQSAENHIDFFESTLGYYGKKMQNIAFIVSDNCNTNKSIAVKMKVPLLGCCSHRFNLAVMAWMHQHSGLISMVFEVMKKLRVVKNRGILRSLNCNLAPVLAQATRWSSTFSMLNQFIKMEPIISANLASFDWSRPSKLAVPYPSTENRFSIRRICTRLADFDSITKYLQSNNCSLSEARFVFDTLHEEACMWSYLAPNSRIMIKSGQVLESLVVKCQNQSRETPTFSPAERALLTSFRPAEVLIEPVDQTTADAAPSYAEEALRRQRASLEPVRSLPTFNYMPPTSNDCERLFSTAKLILSDHRTRMAPRILECLLFLKTNRSFWTEKTVQEIFRVPGHFQGEVVVPSGAVDPDDLIPEPVEDDAPFPQDLRPVEDPDGESEDAPLLADQIDLVVLYENAWSEE